MCKITFNGRTTIDTVRSETARLTIKKLGVILSGVCVNTDTITKMFPKKNNPYLFKDNPNHVIFWDFIIIRNTKTNNISMHVLTYYCNDNN